MHDSPCWITQQRERELRLVGVGVIHAARGAFKPVCARPEREREERVWSTVPRIK